ncbi:MAG TPA: DUF3343 domain-containing protein [Ruminiclostridium sp.]|nr:DUF3343 domain-containing protein [Ruminiclostridium sp.]
MIYYYVLLQSKTHALLLDRRMKGEGITCELAIMPREIMMDLCNLGIKFEEGMLQRAVAVITRSGIPGCKLYKENVYPGYNQYVQVPV